MSDEQHQGQLPPALAAVLAYPTLRRQVGPSLLAQARRVAERTAGLIAQPALVAALDEQIHGVSGGMVMLEGPAGSGTTSLLCQLAAARPWPLWIPDDDAGGGLEALCAQLLALYDLPVPLVPPAAGRDAAALERLLVEAAGRRADGRPVVVLIDQLGDPSATPVPLPFPANVPPGVVLLYACTVGAPAPMPPVARVTLIDTPEQRRGLVELALRLGCDAALAEELAGLSGGSFLFVRLAAGLLESGMLRRRALPDGLAALHEAWWKRLDALGRRLAQLLAAAGAPLPLDRCAELAGAPVADLERVLGRWATLLERDGQQVALYHASTRAFVAAKSPDHLVGAHASFVRLAHGRSGGQPARLDPAADAYLLGQLARHLALGDDAGRPSAPPLVERAWVLARQRHNGDLRAAAADAAWDLRRLVERGPAQHLTRAAGLAGTLALLARSLPADGLAEAVLGALARGDNREATVRRARALVDQLPDGRDKAVVLRRLGEACYEQRMRGQAMRMLAEALDLEVPGLPRSWRDEREETLVAFARAAIGAGAPDLALGITTRIGHAERRGLIETEVVRSLLARGLLTRAEEVAYAIGHAHTHEWAMAEVAVGHARAGDRARAAEVLGTLRTETAVAWARGELACEDIAAGQHAAAEDIASLPNPRLRDRALGQVARALVSARQHELALATARRIADDEVRARALMDLALMLPPNAPVALLQAGEAIGTLGGDDRTPMMVALSTAYATIGDIGAALQTAGQLTEDEERDRAHSRIAVALARQGDHNAGRKIAMAIPDDDERAWTLHELARLLGEAGDWHSATALVDQIGDAEQRARAEADVCIARARAGHAVVAHEQAALIAVADERIRAYVAIADALVQQGSAANAFATLGQLAEPAARSRYQAALAAALANHDELFAARSLALSIPRRPERMRALVAVARAADSPDQIRAALGPALQLASALGRSETFVCLSSAAEPLTRLDGAEALLAAAHALDEIDSWWTT